MQARWGWLRSVALPAALFLLAGAIFWEPFKAFRRSHGASTARPPGFGYMPARWRLAPFDEVNRTVFWVSHIVVAYKGATGELMMRPGEWHPDDAPPDRSEGAALALALTIAEKAAKDPDGFSELARKYSDDIVTKGRGGSLGGVRAGQIPAEYRDALAVLKPGEISRVVKTSAGYVVLMRRTMPAEMSVAGQRIVIRYRGTFGGLSGTKSERTREDALKLAMDVASRARANPRSFDDLVRQYSENEDRRRLGDIGQWSTRNPGFSGREVEALAEVGVGDTTAPLETSVGFQILKRTDGSPRPQYADTAVAIRYNPLAPDDAQDSRRSAERTALELAQKIQQTPAIFESLQHTYCCELKESWALGKEPIGLAEVLDKLEIGGIAPVPIESEAAFVIPKRLDPATLPGEPGPLYELPSPRGPDFDSLMRQSNAPVLAVLTRRFAGELAKAKQFDSDRSKKLEGILEQLATSLEKNPDDADARAMAFHESLSRIKAALGDREFQNFSNALDDFGARELIGGGA